MSRLQFHPSHRLPFSPFPDGRSALVPRSDFYHDRPSTAGFALTCVLIVAVLALIVGTAILSLFLHGRHQGTGLRRKGGRLGLVLVTGELFMLGAMALNGFFYGNFALGKSELPYRALFLWPPIFLVLDGLAKIFIVGLTFHLLHHLLLSYSSNPQGNVLRYVNYILLSIFASLIIAEIGIGFDISVKEIKSFDSNSYDLAIPEGEYRIMENLFIATYTIYAIFAIYWLVLAIIVFAAGSKMQVPAPSSTRLILTLVQVFFIIIPTIFIGVYMAIWNGVALRLHHQTAWWLFVLTDVLNYVCNVAAYVGLVIIFAKRPSSAGPVAPTRNQQYQQPVATQIPNTGIAEMQGSGLYHLGMPQGAAVKRAELDSQPTPMAQGQWH